MRYGTFGLLISLALGVLVPSAASAHRPADPPHQRYEMGDLALEIGQFLDVVTQRGATLR